MMVKNSKIAPQRKKGTTGDEAPEPYLGQPDETLAGNDPKASISLPAWLKANEFSLALILLIVLMGIAFGFRIQRLNVGLWYDEYLTYVRGGNSVEDILKSELTPLNSLLVHAALQITDSPSIIRIHSVFAGTLGTGAVFLFVRAAFGITPAFFAGLFFAFSRTNVFFSREGRYYAVFMLAAALGLLALEGIRRRRDLASVLLYAFAINIGLLTHITFSLFFAATHLALTILWFRGRSEGARGWLKAISGWAGISLLSITGIIAMAIHHDLGKVLGLVAGDGAASTAGSTGKELHYLTFTQYRRILYGYLPLGTGFWRDFFIYLSLLAGFGYSLIRGWHFALIAFLYSIAFPFCLFFIPVKHWYSERYFTASVPIMMIAMGIGVYCLALVSYLAVRKTGQKFGAPKGNRILGAAALVSAAVMTFVATRQIIIPSHARIRSIAVSFPDRDWPPFLNRMTPFLESGDFIGYSVPTKWSPTRWVYTHKIIIDFYIKHAFGKTNPAKPAFIQHAKINDLKQLEDLADKVTNSGNTVWLFAEKLRDQPGDMRQKYSFAGSQVHISPHTARRNRLFVFGPETYNFISDGGFENDGTIDQLRKAQCHAPPEETFSGRATLKLASDEPLIKRISFNVERDDKLIVNGRFAQLHKNIPQSWRILSGSPEEWEYEIEKTLGSRVLKMSANDSPMSIVQDIPLTQPQKGNLSIIGYGYAEAPGELEFHARVYQGNEMKSYVVRHPGGKEWLAMRSIPAKMDVPVTRIEVEWRATPKTGNAIKFGHSEVDFGHISRLLPGEKYIFSCWLRYEKVKRGDHNNAIGRITMRGRNAGYDKLWYRDLYTFQGTRDWHHVSIPIEVGVDMPEIGRDLTFEIGNWGGTGRIWADNVQLERRRNATPFVDSYRPPPILAFHLGKNIPREVQGNFRTVLSSFSVEPEDEDASFTMPLGRMPIIGHKNGIQGDGTVNFWSRFTLQAPNLNFDRPVESVQLEVKGELAGDQLPRIRFAVLTCGSDKPLQYFDIEAKTTEFQTVEVPAQWEPGCYELRFAFLNDGKSADRKKDRNIFVRNITFIYGDKN